MLETWDKSLVHLLSSLQVQERRTGTWFLLSSNISSQAISRGSTSNIEQHAQKRYSHNPIGSRRDRNYLWLARPNRIFFSAFQLTQPFQI